MNEIFDILNIFLSYKQSSTEILKKIYFQIIDSTLIVCENIIKEKEEIINLLEYIKVNCKICNNYFIIKLNILITSNLTLYIIEYIDIMFQLNFEINFKVWIINNELFKNLLRLNIKLNFTEILNINDIFGLNNFIKINFNKNIYFENKFISLDNNKKEVIKSVNIYNPLLISLYLNDKNKGITYILKNNIIKKNIFILIFLDKGKILNYKNTNFLIKNNFDNLNKFKEFIINDTVFKPINSINVSIFHNFYLILKNETKKNLEKNENFILYNIINIDYFNENMLIENFIKISESSNLHIMKNKGNINILKNDCKLITNLITDINELFNDENIKKFTNTEIETHKHKNNWKIHNKILLEDLLISNLINK